ncbi:MAG: 30S ribosome-binding factor RbfA [Oscillospiraceae bacterium]|nr:30S ribosome-binding factor RbfA [Oscillospiraceae bacterium]
MPSFKAIRLNEDVMREMTAILRTVKDPRVADNMVSVIRTDLTNDMSHCTVYVSSLKGMESTKEAVKGLVSAQGYIKKMLCSALKLRKCPELHFVADDSIEHSAKISKMLRGLVKEDENGEDLIDE